MVCRAYQLLIFLCLSLAGCVSLWAESKLRVVWETPLPERIEFIHRLGGGELLLLEGKENVYLVKSSDGHVEWKYPLPGKGASTFLVKPQDILLVMPGDNPATMREGQAVLTGGHTVAVDLISRKETRLEGKLEAPFYLESQKSVLGLLDGSSIALIAPGEARVLWKSGLRSKLNDVLNYTLDTERGACVVLGSAGRQGVLASIRLADGELEWETELKGLFGQPVGVQQIVPIIHEDSVFVELDGLSRINRQTGELRWHTPYVTWAVGSVVLERPNAMPVFHDGDVFTAAVGRVRRIDLATGAVKWTSKDYSVIPLLVPTPDSIVAMTGGILRSAVEEVTIGQLLGAIMGAVQMGMATGGRIMAPVYSFPGILFTGQGAAPEGQTEIEGVDVHLLLDGQFHHKKPGVVKYDLATGKEIYSHVRANPTSVLETDGATAIVGDRNTVEQVDLSSGERSTVLTAGGAGLGKQLLYVLRRNEGEYLVISATPPSAAKSLVALRGTTPKFSAAKLSLRGGRVLWSADLGKKFLDVTPLAYDGKRTFLMYKELAIAMTAPYGIIAVDEQTGSVLWQQRVPQRGWSLYPQDRVLVYYDRKAAKLVYSVEEGS